MGDIVRRISDWSRNIPHNPWHGDDLLIEAAHEIEKLRGERDALRAERDEANADAHRLSCSVRVMVTQERSITGDVELEAATALRMHQRRLAATPQPPADDDQGGDQ